jgi:hypothetical protein
MSDYAFPSPTDPKTGFRAHGMTMRDYFAIKIFQSLLHRVQFVHDDSYKPYIRKAYLIADMMILARELPNLENENE